MYHEQEVVLFFFVRNVSRSSSLASPSGLDCGDCIVTKVLLATARLIAYGHLAGVPLDQQRKDMGNWTAKCFNVLVESKVFFTDTDRNMGAIIGPLCARYTTRSQLHMDSLRSNSMTT